MESAPRAQAETAPAINPLVHDVLQRVAWGVDVYPSELLELQPTEQELLTRVTAGEQMADIARERHVSLTVATSRYNVARGKMQARQGLDADIWQLSSLGQRIVVLNELFGPDWSKGHSVLASTDTGTLLRTAQRLDGLLGENWRHCPQLCLMNAATLEERITRYDVTFGPTWRSKPVLLTQNPAVVERRTALYDERFGAAWRAKPALLTNDPNTVISSARALETIGVTQGNTPRGPYFNLLCTSVANKRRKVIFIRRQLLGHQEIYMHENAVPLADLVQARQDQTTLSLARERRELAELHVFLHSLGAAGLTKSQEAIRTWAVQHGYRRPIQGE